MMRYLKSSVAAVELFAPETRMEAWSLSYGY